jgi:RsiW-degrading membrane proteinase PrsW (M82 family)
VGGSAFLTLLAIVFIQIPLQYYINRGLNNAWAPKIISDWYLLTGIPAVLVSGLVQEAAKLVPMAIWWWRSRKNITPKMGIIIGAAAGAGFGIFEAFWVHTNLFAAGWTTQLISQYGFDGILGFWERFFTVGFHIAVSALVGYGLAKGKWWQCFLIAASLHTLGNYSNVFATYFVYINPAEWLKVAYIEIYITVITVIVTAVVLWLRWRKTEEIPVEPIISVAPVETLEPPAEIIS